MGRSESLFAAFTVPPSMGAPANARPEPGLLRWTEDGVVVIQTTDLRLRWDGDTLWEDGPHGHFQHDEATADQVADVVAAVRKGLHRRRIRAVSPGELPQYLWSPGVDLFRIKLARPWAENLRLVMGIDPYDGELLELSVTDETGRPMRYRGYTLRATFGRVDWGVPLGPDMAETHLVPLHQLGSRTVFDGKPPTVARDLPYHERVQHHALAFRPEQSTGVQGAHGHDVIDVLMPTLWCDTADASSQASAQLVFEVDESVASHRPLRGASEAGCALWLSTEPRSAHVATEGVTSSLDLTASVTGPDGAEVWSSTQHVSHTGTADAATDVRFEQPLIRGALPQGTPTTGLRLVLDLDMQVQCTVPSGKGRVRTYVSGIARPRVHWRCPEHPSGSFVVQHPVADGSRSAP